MAEYSIESVQGQRRAGLQELYDGKAGDWAILNDDTNTVIWVMTPNGTERGTPARLPVNCADGWQWDGNADAPTITPSIHRLPSWNCTGWHGWMRDGKLESC